MIKGTNFFGQARAHVELSKKWDVRWKLVAHNTVQAVAIGAERCAEALCGAATDPWYHRASDGTRVYSPNQRAIDLPLWSEAHWREGIGLSK